MLYISNTPMEVNAAAASRLESATVSEFQVRSATVADSAAILAFIRELAEYEQLLSEVTATEAAVRSTLFGAKPQAEVLLAFHGAEPAGFALFFHNYSTFLARHGLYLEDLYVRPAYRGRGCGRRLLAHLAAIARERGCGRLEWAVLNWNESAIAFYQSLGAKSVEGWKLFRLTGDSLNELADGA